MVKIYRFAQVLYLIICFNYLPLTPLCAQSVERIDRLRNKAEKLYGRGEYGEALIAYLEGYQLARYVDTVRAANLTVDISAIYHIQRNYRQGVSICQEGVALLQRAKTQSDSVWFKLNSSLGEMYKKLNNQDSCYLYFSRANSILQKHPNLENQIADYVIYHYNNQGMMYVRKGGYTEGVSYLTKALSVAERRTTSKKDIAILQNNLGEVYDRLGLFSKGMQLRQSAASAYQDNDPTKYYICSGIAWDALLSRNYPEAYRSAQNALAVYQHLERQGIPKQKLPLKSIILQYLGDYYLATQKPDQADRYYDMAIAESAKTVGREYVLSKLGKSKIQQLRNNLPESLRYAEQAIHASYTNSPSADGSAGEQSLFQAYVQKATLLTKQFQQRQQIKVLQTALTTYQEALLVADAVRKSYNALDTKWFFATQVRSAYLHAFEAAYLLYNRTQKQADLEQAFSFLERAKAVALADVTRELLIKPANVPATLLTQEQDLQRTITAERLEPASASSPKLLDAQIQLAQLQQRLEQEFPTYYRAKYQPQTVQVTQVQKRLDNNTAYLSYLVAQDALYIAVVTQDGLTVVQKKGDLTPFKTSLKTLTAALYTNPGLGNYTGTSAAILSYRWLIEPVLTLLKGKERWIISRDGDLHRIPFEVLETGRVIDDFLVKKYAISYVLSANTLLNPGNVTPVSTKNALLGMAPFVKPLDPKTPPLPLPYLPASQAEVEQLPGEFLLGKAATKQRFMRDYLNHNILHLATHAYANDIEPARSYIAFYPDGSVDKLYTEEIHNLSLPHTRLVTLSACETGNGKLQAGEGVMSLAQAFTYAGCPSVISTLWSAHDESMAYLSQQLYKHLQDGLSIDVALQRSRLDYFQSALYPKLNHPHYWANLTLLGDSSPIYVVAWPATTLFVIILLFILVMGSLWLFRQRKLTNELTVS